MLILGIDTSTENCSVGLVRDGAVIGERSQRQRNIHAEKLLEFIDSLFQNDILFSEIDGIAVSIGPGSYTGLRIGLSAAKGLAYPHRLPLLPVSTLAVLAAGTGITSRKTLFYIHSHKNLVYYRIAGPAEIIAVDTTVEQAEIGDVLMQNPDLQLAVGNTSFTGYDIEFLERYPDGAVTALLGERHFEKLSGTDPVRLEPQYWSAFQAVKWQPGKR